MPPTMPTGFSQQSHSGVSHGSDRTPLGLPTEASILTSATNERRLTHRRDHGVQSRQADGSKGNEIYFVGACAFKNRLGLLDGGVAMTLPFSSPLHTHAPTHPPTRQLLLSTGVIDILQQYNSFKRAETFFKSFKYDSRQISAVEPAWYARRFVDFCAQHIS